MTATWTLKEHSSGEMIVTVEGEKWQQAIDKAFRKLSGNLEVRGFRKGQVPRKIAEARISGPERQYEAVQESVDTWLQEGLAETGVVPISQPMVDIRNISDENVTLAFMFTIMPEVKLGDYKEIEYELPETTVTEEEVEAEINRMREKYADISVKEEPAALGDTVNIDYRGFKDGVAFEGGEAEGFDLELGSGTFIPGFEDQLVGAKAGEEKDLDLSFPEEYPAADLAGAAVVFHVKVNEVKGKVLPDLDDDFAKDCNIPQVETVEDLRRKINETQLRDKKAEAERAADDDFLAQVCAVSEVDIPEVLIQNETEAMYQQMAQQIAAYGMKMEQYLQMVNSTEDQVKESYRADAERTVKQRLVLGAISKAEGLEPTDEDVEAEYNNLAVMYDVQLDMVKNAIGRDMIEDQIRTTKAFNFLKDNAKKA